MNASKPPLTTVSVDASVRDRINAEAVRLDLSQRKMISRMVEAYDLSLKKEDSSPIDIQDIYDILEKLLKRDDRVIAFIREQEKVLLKPILNGVQSTDARISQLIQTLSNLN